MDNGQNRTPVRPIWADGFITALAETGNVRLASHAAKVPRSVTYELRQVDKSFAAEWKHALQQAADLLEAEARRRAYFGVDEPVIYQGELSTTWVNPETGEPVAPRSKGSRRIPLTVKKYSDQLLMFLMKGAKPQKYRDKMQVSGDRKQPIQVEMAVSLTDEQRVDGLVGLAERIRQRRAGVVDANGTAGVGSVNGTAG